MSDERLRELERRWRASKSNEDEAAFLAEQIRVGALRASRVALAAVLGHATAIRATSVSAAPLDDTFRGALRDAIRGDEEAMARACVAVALHLLWTVPGEAEHDPRNEQQMTMAIMLLREACQRILMDIPAVGDAADAADAMIRVYLLPTEPVRITPLEETVYEVARFTFEWTAEGRAATYQAIAHGLIPWLLGRGDQVQEWINRI